MSAGPTGFGLVQSPDMTSQYSNPLLSSDNVGINSELSGHSHQHQHATRHLRQSSRGPWKAIAITTFSFLIALCLSTSEILLRKRVTTIDMKNYIITLAILITVATTIVFFIIHQCQSCCLFAKLCRPASGFHEETVFTDGPGADGYATLESLSRPRRCIECTSPGWMILIAILDSIALHALLYSSRHISAGTLAIPMHLAIPVTAILTRALFGRSHSRVYVVASVGIAIASILVVIDAFIYPPSTSDDLDMDLYNQTKTAGWWALAAMGASLPVALASVLREKMLTHPDSRVRLDPLELSSFVAARQAFVTFCFSPFVFAVFPPNKIHQLPVDVYPNIVDGFKCWAESTNTIILDIIPPPPLDECTSSTVHVTIYVLVVVALNVFIIIAANKGLASVYLLGTACAIPAAAFIARLGDNVLGDLTTYLRPMEWCAVGLAFVCVALARNDETPGGTHDEEALSPGIGGVGLLDEAVAPTFASSTSSSSLALHRNQSGVAGSLHGARHPAYYSQQGQVPVAGAGAAGLGGVGMAGGAVNMMSIYGPGYHPHHHAYHQHQPQIHNAPATSSSIQQQQQQQQQFAFGNNSLVTQHSAFLRAQSNTAVAPTTTTTTLTTVVTTGSSSNSRSTSRNSSKKSAVAEYIQPPA